MEKKKIAIFATNASQYHVPIYQALARDSSIELSVFYSTDLGIKGFYDKQSNSYVEWDIDLSSGYNFMVFKNLASRENRGFFRAINFGVIPWLLRNKYDLVLLQGYNTLTLWLVYLTALLTQPKLTWRGEAIIYKNKNKFLFYLKKIILFFYFKGFHTVFYSCSGNKDYLRQFVFQDQKLKLFPCAVDNNYFYEVKEKYQDSRQSFRESYSISEDEIVILFAARLIDRKRPHDLLMAVKQINHPKIVLLFCGDGPEKESLKKASTGLGNRVIFTGFLGQEELAKHYLIADIYTILSDYDNSPKTLNEALNFALPTIATNMIGNAADLIHSGENGFIAEARNVPDIANKLELIIKNLDHFKKSSNFISNKLLQKWSINEDIQALKKIL